jgi:hypothetical protein
LNLINHEYSILQGRRQRQIEKARKMAKFPVELDDVNTRSREASQILAFPYDGRSVGCFRRNAHARRDRQSSKNSNSQKQKQDLVPRRTKTKITNVISIDDSFFLVGPQNYYSTRLGLLLFFNPNKQNNRKQSRTMKLFLSAVVLLAWSSSPGAVDAFIPTTPRHGSMAGRTITKQVTTTTQGMPMAQKTTSMRVVLMESSSSDDEGEEDGDEPNTENPYADPNYPELEFVNYDDPEYQVDQGVGDEFLDPDSTEEKVEAMREERRMKNDEYQFETYYKEILKEGQEYKGEWTVFTTSTFHDDEEPGGIPKIKKAGEPMMVISKGERIEVKSSTDATHRLENERLVHHEKIFTDSEKGEKSPEQLKQEEISMSRKCWPEEMASGDFRGQQGIMCVGNGYTVCTGVKLTEDDGGDDLTHEGPFAEYRSELGIQYDDLRFRVKLDYAVTEAEKKATALPPLRLRSFTVCRETLNMWPRAANYKSAIQALTDEVFFGTAGAAGGLYDPPPVGSEEQAGQYLLLDLEGGATLLLPYQMDQDPTVHEEPTGWVTSLDWTPGKFRFQVDRKNHGGKDILGLRTLELSEVQAADSDTYRPADGGSDMRQ